MATVDFGKPKLGERREVPLFDKEFENLLKTDPELKSHRAEEKRKEEEREEEDVVIGAPPKKKKHSPPKIQISNVLQNEIKENQNRDSKNLQNNKNKITKGLVSKDSDDNPNMYTEIGPTPSYSKPVVPYLISNISEDHNKEENKKQHKKERNNTEEMDDEEKEIHEQKSPKLKSPKPKKQKQ